MTIEKLDQSAYETIADRTLENIMRVIDEKLGELVEADLVAGILSIGMASGGCYVISKHTPNRQIWMSSPRSGASHFAYDGNQKKWVDTRGGTDLLERLASEFVAPGGARLKFGEN